MIVFQPDAADLAHVERLLKDLPANARFGASVGMNRTANEMQDGIRASLPGKFTLRRRAFIEQTIYRKPGEDFATKDRLIAGVRIHDERDVLAKFEAGGVKRPRDGKSVAVPLAARPSKGSVVPERFKLSTLFFNQRGLFSQAEAILNTKGRGRRRGLLKASAGANVFVSNGIVYMRQGKGRGTKLVKLWVFKKETPLPASLHFVDTAKRIAATRLIPNVVGAIELEISRGLTTKSGTP